MSTILLAISAAFVVLAVPVGAWRARMLGPPVATAAVAHGLRFAVYLEAVDETEAAAASPTAR